LATAKHAPLAGICCTTGGDVHPVTLGSDIETGMGMEDHFGGEMWSFQDQRRTGMTKNMEFLQECQPDLLQKSNCAAPSRDIATTFAVLEQLRFLCAGGIASSTDRSVLDNATLT